MGKIRLALVDGHQPFRQRLATWLRQIDGFDLVMDVSNGQELIDQLPHQMPDVVLLDLQMPMLDDPTTVDYLYEHYPLLKIIALTMPGEVGTVTPLLKKGVCAYVSKNAHRDNIRRTVQGVFNGDRYKTELIWRVVRRKTTDKTTGADELNPLTIMGKIKLALVDDHTLFRQGLATMLRLVHDFDLVLEAANGQEFIDKLPRRMPDVVLLDLQMPVMDGPATADYLRENYPLIKIIVLTMHDEDRMVLHLLEKGVSGYLLKDADTAEVEKAVRKVLDEGVYLTEFVSRAMHRKMTNKTTIVKPPTLYNSKVVLSEREKEVLKLICEGLSTAEVSEKIFLSPRTVEGHRLRILEKTGTKNTAGMVAYAFKNDMVE